MQHKELPDLTNEELLKEKKKIKNTNIGTAVLIGLFLGIAIYGAVNNGLGFGTFLPLFFVFIFFMNGKRSNALNKELESRNIK